MKTILPAVLTSLASVFLMAATPVSGPVTTGSTTPPKPVPASATPAATPSVTAAPAAASNDRIAQIRARGHLRCGVNGQTPGFSAANGSGRMEGFDADFCRAVAAAIFGKGDAVKFTNLTAATRFPALAAGEIDVLSRNTTATFSRDTELNAYFGPPMFYDGQGILASPKLGASSVLELANQRICAPEGSTTIRNLGVFYGKNNIPVKIVPAKDNNALVAGLKAGDCDAISSDTSVLATLRLNDAALKDYNLLPEHLSKDPLAPAVLRGDERLAALMRWTVHALMQAEELGISQTNFARLAASGDTEIAYFLGARPGIGKGLGLDDKWVSNVIEAVGNYGEMFDRHIGKNSPFKLTRGPNRSWLRGGLQYPLPFR
jgi:general L-amino acid transport system substrate-binding protein